MGQQQKESQVSTGCGGLGSGRASGFDGSAVVGLGKPVVAKPCLRHPHRSQGIRPVRIQLDRPVKVPQGRLRLFIVQQLMAGHVGVEFAAWIFPRRLLKLGFRLLGLVELAPSQPQEKMGLIVSMLQSQRFFKEVRSA